MSGTSYSVTNLYGETREFTLLVSSVPGKSAAGPILDSKVIPRGGFIHRTPTQIPVGIFKYIRVIAKDATTEAKRNVASMSGVARVEIRLTPKGELDVVARGSNWKKVPVNDVPENAGIIWPPPPNP